MTDPEQQPTFPTDTTRHRLKVLIYCVFIVVVVMGSILGTYYVHRHARSIKSDIEGWRSSYNSLLHSPKHTDQKIVAFLKTQLQQFHTKHQRYPNNNEGLDFIDTSVWNNAYPEPPIWDDQTFDGNMAWDERERAKKMQREALIRQFSHLKIVGSTAWLCPVRVRTDLNSFHVGSFDLAYVYVNKRGLPDNLLADLKDYEAPEQALLNRIDDGIFIYSPDWCNAYYYNLEIAKLPKWFVFWTVIQYVIPVTGFILLCILLVSYWRMVRNTPRQREKRQLLFVSILALIGISFEVSWSAPNRFSCYAIILPEPRFYFHLGSFRQSMWQDNQRKENLYILLESLQKRGVLSKEIVERTVISFGERKLHP